MPKRISYLPIKQEKCVNALGMAARPTDSPPIVERVRAEQATAWVMKGQGWTPHFLFTVLSGISLTVHAVPSGPLLYRLLWTGEGVLLYEVGLSGEPYRFRNVQGTLVFLDVLLMQYVARLAAAVAPIAEAPLWAQDRKSG